MMGIRKGTPGERAMMVPILSKAGEAVVFIRFHWAALIHTCNRTLEDVWLNLTLLNLVKLTPQYPAWSTTMTHHPSLKSGSNSTITRKTFVAVSVSQASVI